MPETALLAPKAFRSPDQSRKRSRAERPANPIATHPPQRRHRTIFISDTHLGTRGCKAEALADFLAHNDCATLFLVGDIVDGWQLKRRWYWTEAQSRVVARNPAQGGSRHARDLRAGQS